MYKSLYIYIITSYYNEKLNVKYVTNNLFCYTEKPILLKNLKFQLDTDQKIILLNYQNNYVKRSN